ncbi:MAG: transcriptional regulator [Sphingobacteriales bacterium SCN 48-20]|uniref:LacI family DNA-binding transcriptional regulator n=1 Tax=Terrimonas ferruginea TaxID=249 RepID=UPI00086A14D0|nr:substrate-binding domain-containing protein [Terrimonas ferruginea]MBN8783766.1 substrate-binding domain-containing protein [Terrimonas ferruginea]ODT91236.1 MAG: transcriptional regulator [Sphingobacteriales bacterium SCN 48-20]OJW40812.1 MAG: transcriptional regulator [Sphingobacteriales bacterium 48-107]
MKKNNNDKASGGVKEIARLANVSIATVDRVIHNREGVSQKTKNKIQEIIRKLNYQPNVLARRLALASRGTLRLAVLLPTASNETEFWQAPLEGINQAETEIKQYGIEIERYFFDQNDQRSFATQVKKIIKSAPDGILFTPIFPDESVNLIEKTRKAGTPYVLINSDIPGYDCLCYIGAEIFQSGYLAAQLINYGIRRKQKVLIAKIAREIDNNYAILRKEDGFRAYFQNNSLHNQLVTFDTTETDYAAVSRKLDRLLKKEQDIAAIYVTNSRVSLVARYLEQAGLKDIVLIGYDFTTDNVEYLDKGTIDFLICEKPQEQGYKGIMTLFQHLVYSNPIEKNYLMPIDIITKENHRFYRN